MLFSRLSATLGLVFSTHAFAVNITYSCAGAGRELELCKLAASEWSKQTGNTVKVLTAPNSTTERLALYQQQFAAGASDIDVMQIDVIWPSILASHLVDLNPYISKEIKDQHFAAIIENNTVNGKFVALPLYTDAGLLFYRKDLLEKYKLAVPKTWAELGASAKTIVAAERKAGKKELWGYVFQGRAYEGLTCNALEWIVSNNGGTIVDDKGQVTIANDKASEAVDRVASWMGDIVPEGTLNYSEEEARGVFQAGNAVFMRNWPYAWNLANEAGSAVKSKVGVAVLPKGNDGGRHAATLGGWSLAVSKYSKHQAEAAKFVAFLGNIENQRRRAIDASYNPTIVSLYKDKQILKVNPFIGDLYETFVSAVARPSRVTGSQYNRVSSEFWESVHRTLSKKTSAKDAFKQLDTKLKRLSRNGKW